MATELTLDGGVEAVERLRLSSDRILGRLTEEMNVLMLRLQGHIVSDKLHGQVLKQRTGNLAGSINAQETRQEGTALIGEVTGGGGIAWYGKLHEYGFGPYDYE